MEMPTLEELMVEHAPVSETKTGKLLVFQLHHQALNGNASGVKQMLTCLVRLKHLGQCKLPADIAQAVAAFSK